MRVCAYVYPGWHAIPEREIAFGPGFTEWELVDGATPRFPGHAQPRRPRLGRYDDRDPQEVGRRIALAREHGVDAFAYGFFWCRGKRVFQDALDEGFLKIPAPAPFSLMWANRMPRRVLPVRRADGPVIDRSRLVSSDVEDFVALLSYVGERYLRRDEYVRLDGRAYFSIFDSTFFVRELGRDAAKEAIARARAALRRIGVELHLAAIDPALDVIADLAALGFDSVTHYVLLPYWKGEAIQDYATVAERRAEEWSGYAARSSLPYFPSVATGWDATPRGADFGDKRPNKYPWHPVVTGESPAAFEVALRRALEIDAPLTFVASLNEWSEGHYLEPDDRFGMGWLEAVRNARASITSARRRPGISADDT
jgi:hypothetical protein